MKALYKVIQYSWDLKRHYLIVGFLVVVTSLLGLATPFALKAIVDELTITGLFESVNEWKLWWLVGFIFATNLAYALLNNIQGYHGDMLSTKLNTLLSRRYYDHILKLPLSYYDKEVAGRITSQLDRSITTITNLTQALANTFVGFFLTSLFTIVVLAVYAPPVAIALLVLFPFYGWVTQKSSVRWQAKQESINADTDISRGRFVESVNQIRVVKSFAQEAAEFAFFTNKRRRIENQTSAQSVEWHWFDVFRRTGLSIAFLVIYAYIVVGTKNGDFSVGELVFMVQLVTQAQMPLFGISFVVDQIQRAKAGSKDFFDVMNTKPDIVDAPNAMPIKVGTGRIEFNEVRFQYDTGPEVLKGLSFSIEPGARVALVGESGEGKSTISNLLLRFYSPQSGNISIDGTNIDSVTQQSLRDNIGVVFQEPALFSGTIRENIAYGRPNATDEEVAEAARIANASKFIERFANKYDTEIGERGVRLSGGQKQRIAIARAVLKNPPILIFDEATSSLDSRSEAEVQQALDRLMHGRSTLVIAHRLSTIASVDKVVCIRGGVVEEQGSPAQLASTGGMYSTLLSLQDTSRPDHLEVLRKFGLAPAKSQDDDDSDVDTDDDVDSSTATSSGTV